MRGLQRVVLGLVFKCWGHWVPGSPFQETRRGPQTPRSGAAPCLGEAVVSQEDCPSITHQPVHWERSFWQHQSQLVVAPEPAKNWMWPASWVGWPLVVQLLGRVRLFATPWTAACQTSLSFTVSRSLLKLMSVELVMPSTISSFVVPSPPAFSHSQH